MESDYFEEDEPEIQVANYTLTRLTNRALDVQVNFEMPRKITQVASEPDNIAVSFKNGLLFMDLEQTQLDNKLSIKTSIKPQMSQAEIAELVELSKNVASSMATLSIAIIAL